MVEQLKLVKKLIEKKCKIYGSSRCGWSKKQTDLFTDKEAKKLFLENVYKNVQDMKEKPKINGYPTLECGDKKYSGFKTLEQLENFVKTGKFPEPVKKDLTCEQKLANLEKKVKRPSYNFWVYADNVKVIPGKDKINDKIIFCNIKSTTEYQIYNEFNKELNKNRKVTKLKPEELNETLNAFLSPEWWIPTCYMEYERCRDKKLRSFAFDLYKSKYCNGQLIFEVKLSHLDGNPDFLTKLKKPENGKYVACNIDKISYRTLKNIPTVVGLWQRKDNVCQNFENPKKQCFTGKKKSVVAPVWCSYNKSNNGNGLRYTALCGSGTAGKTCTSGWKIRTVSNYGKRKGRFYNWTGEKPGVQATNLIFSNERLCMQNKPRGWPPSICKTYNGCPCSKVSCTSNQCNCNYFK